MKIYFFIFSLFILSSYVQSETVNCDIFGERVQLGDYYTNANEKDFVLNIAANTKEKCENIELVVLDEKSSELQRIQHFQQTEIDANKLAAEGFSSEYKVHTYFFKVGNDQAKEGQPFYYRVDQKGSKQYFQDNKDIPFSVTIPYKTKTEGEIDSLFVFGDYDANVQEMVDGEENLGQPGHDYLMDRINNRDKLDFDHMLFLGDLAYDIKDEDYMRGEKYFKKVTPYYAQIPQTISYGNHESGSQQENFEYRFADRYFQNPGFKEGKNRNFQFDSIYGQFINFDSKYIWYNEAKEDKEKIVKQLEEQLILAQERRNERPWIVVFSHYPVYVTSEDGSFDEKYEDYRKVDELLKEYKVDLFLGAHEHGYQRFHPAFDGELANYEKVYTNPDKEEGLEKNKYKNPEAPVHVMEGLAGQAYFTYRETYKDRDLMASQDTGIPGAAYLKIYNATHMQYSHFRFVDESVIDDFWIIKEGRTDEDTHLMWVIGFTAGGLVLVGIILTFCIIYIRRKQGRKYSDASSDYHNQNELSNASHENDTSA